MVSSVFLVYLIVVVFPIIFWFSFFQRQDRAEPEPKKLLFKVFFGGILVVALASILEAAIEGIFFPQISATMGSNPSAGLRDFLHSPVEMLGFLAIYFIAGPVEEFMKFFVVKSFVYRKIAFNQVADGIIYAVTIALSFSLIENSIYFVNILDDVSLSPEFVAIVIIRGVITTMLHVMAAAIMGLYLGRAKFSGANTRKLMLKGVVIASLVHGIFNVLIFFPYGMLINIVLLILCYRYIMRELKTEKSQMVWRLVVPEKEISEMN